MSNRPGGFVITTDSKIVHFPPSRDNYSSFYQQRTEPDTKDQVPTNWLFAYWGDDYHDRFHFKNEHDIEQLGYTSKGVVYDALLKMLSALSTELDPYKLTDEVDGEYFVLQFPREYTTFEYSIPYCLDC